MGATNHGHDGDARHVRFRGNAVHQSAAELAAAAAPFAGGERFRRSTLEAQSISVRGDARRPARLRDPSDAAA